MKIIGVAIILFFISDLALAAEKTAKPTCLTSKCHAQFLAKIPEGSMRHSPLKAKGCNICHLTKPGLSAVQQGKLPPKHPILKNQTISEINLTCLICHDTQKENLEELKIHHDAIENGCTSCHNPHSSKNKNLLKFNKYSQEFCFSCHEEMQSKIESAANTHEGMSEKKACLG
ncbi:MAG: hypothetical protein HY843_05380, partial [Bdellovibrio sp.]|nr:hypothetical protein [Bdellovibrio sp.]